MSLRRLSISCVKLIATLLVAMPLSVQAEDLAPISLVRATSSSEGVSVASPVMKKPEMSSTDLLRRLERVERGISAMQRQVYLGDSQAASPKSAGGGVDAAQIESRFEGLGQQMRVLRGELEELQFEITKVNDKLVKLSSDVEYRLNEVSRQGSGNGVKDPLANVNEELMQDKVPVGSDQQALNQREEDEERKQYDKASRGDEEEYQAAYIAVKERDFDGAYKMLDKYIGHYPHGKHVDEAHFWMGEILYSRQEYDSAAIQYLKGYQYRPKGNRGPDNLLKLGESLGLVKKRREACLTLIKLKREFPNASNSVKKNADEQIKKLQCE